MTDVADMADIDDSERHSRRDRFLDALSRTKSKWKKEKVEQPPREEFKLSDDVNDFLAAGRKPAATATVKPIADNLLTHGQSPRPSTSESFHSPQPSPRAPTVPRLDVSQTRWPNARPVNLDPRSRSDINLSPNYNERRQYERSHSFNSALKKGTKPRGLSVTFDKSAPVIIGEGGDESEFPPSEISKARRARSRSLSPYLDRPSSNQSNGSGSRSPQRKPVPSPTRLLIASDEREDSMFQPKPLRRTQTGFSDQEVRTPYVTRDFTKQLEDALKFKEDGSPIDPFSDPPAQSGHTAPPPLQVPSEEGRRLSPVQPVHTGNQLPVAQQFIRTSPQTLQNPTFQGQQPARVLPKAVPFQEFQRQQAARTSPRPPPQHLDRPSPQSVVNPEMHRPQPIRTSPRTLKQPDWQHQQPVGTSPQAQSLADSQRQQLLRTSPQAAHHPDLQHSQETSNKPPPPKVANFYANVNPAKIEVSPVDEKQQVIPQVLETKKQPPPRPPPKFFGKFRRSSGDNHSIPPMASPTSQPPQGSSPGGWI